MLYIALVIVAVITTNKVSNGALIDAVRSLVSII